jgi:hypothetical protein
MWFIGLLTAVGGYLGGTAEMPPIHVRNEELMEMMLLHVCMQALMTLVGLATASPQVALQGVHLLPQSWSQ